MIAMGEMTQGGTRGVAVARHHPLGAISSGPGQLGQQRTVGVEMQAGGYHRLHLVFGVVY
jgi:hypothetical protein